MTVFYKDGSMAIGEPAEIAAFEQARRGERPAPRLVNQVPRGDRQQAALNSISAADLQANLQAQAWQSRRSGG